jgi:tRNA dimethylallyltransferase
MKWHCQMPAGERPEFLVVGGPTASGKSAVGLELAKVFSGSIICCDSVQLYKGFDIGSAKPSLEEREVFPHLLFDEFDWNEPCDAAIYAAKARLAIQKVRSEGSLPIVVGGTGLYLRALLGDAWDDDIPSDPELRASLAERSSDDLYADLKTRDPRRATQLHMNDRYRVIRALEINILTGSPVKDISSPSSQRPRKHLMIFMNPPRDELYARINFRTTQMLRDGLIDEVRELIHSGVDPLCKPMGSIGYKEVVEMLQNKLAPEDLEAAIATATRQYAKRQVTWFKKVPSDAELSRVEDLRDVIDAIKHADFI